MRFFEIRRPKVALDQREVNRHRDAVGRHLREATEALRKARAAALILGETAGAADLGDRIQALEVSIAVEHQGLYRVGTSYAKVG